MDYLFTPWRYAYITTAATTPGCVFCQRPGLADERSSLLVHRGRHNFVILNMFPYTSGHEMVVPYAHLDRFDALPTDAACEMTALAQRMEGVLRELYHPDGINLGMNIGAAAGAGVAGHIHLHVLPRWVADSNFMTTVAETRVLPESLDVTWERIRAALA